jgi:hypothetical protein
MANGSISSKKQGVRSPWMQWVIPSVTDLIFTAFLGLLAYTALSVRLLGDAGIGWHIRTGQLILETHTIPRVDSFSSAMNGRPWFAWEWLYDVMVGWLERVGGLNAVVCFAAVIIALTFALVFRLLLRRGTSFAVAVLLVLLAASASMIHFFARPHVVSWLFTVTWFWILESEEQSEGCGIQKRDRLLWIPPALMLVWVNVHGGFLLGFVLLKIYWLSAVWEYFRLSDDRFETAMQKIRTGKRAVQLLLVGLVTWVVTFANPYGWKLHLHIFQYLSSRFLMDHIDEFQSPNFHFVAQKCFAVLLILTFVAFAFKVRSRLRVRLSEGLIVLFAVYSGLYSARNIPVSSLLLILVIGPRLSRALESFSGKMAGFRSRHGSSATATPNFFGRMLWIESSLRGHVWPVAAVALTGWIAFHGGALGSWQVMNAHFDTNRFPIAAVDYIAQNKIQAVFAPDSWGGYFIYRLYPRSKVVIDDRHDFYGEAFLTAYLKTMHVEPGWQDFLNTYAVECVVVPKETALANILRETPAWQMAYQDNVAVVFIREVVRQ